MRVSLERLAAEFTEVCMKHEALVNILWHKGLEDLTDPERAEQARWEPKCWQCRSDRDPDEDAVVSCMNCPAASHYSCMPDTWQQNGPGWYCQRCAPPRTPASLDSGSASDSDSDLDVTVLTALTNERDELKKEVERLKAEEGQRRFSKEEAERYVAEVVPKIVAEALGRQAADFDRIVERYEKLLAEARS